MIPQSLQAVSAPQLSEDGKSLVQIMTQTMKVSKEQLLVRKAELEKQITVIDSQLAMFVPTVD